MVVQLDNRTSNSLWAFLVRLDQDTVEDVFTFPNGSALSEAQINTYSDALMKLKVNRVSSLDDLSRDALRVFLSRTGVETIERVLEQEWAGTKLTDRQIEEFRFEIFRFYSMHLYIPFQKAEKASDF